MKNKMIWTLAFLLSAALPQQEAAWAHVTPNVQLVSTREAVEKLLPRGKLFVKEVQLAGEQLHKLEAHRNWDIHENRFKFFVTRDDKEQLQNVMATMIEFTRHGPLVVAVGFDSQGHVIDALLTDIQMEPLTWVGPLLSAHFMESFRGKDSGMELAVGEEWRKITTGMTQDYAIVITNAVKKAAQLFDVVFKQ